MTPDPRPSQSKLAVRAADVIAKKRDGRELSAAEIESFVAGYTTGEIPDYQASAWLMAVFLKGMSRAETAALTRAMLDSGKRLDLGELSAAKVGKHSTGGVGDKTSLIVAPLAAACGLLVPMICGRGLGHTGGTLDKLESIPGFNVHLSAQEFRRVLNECGCSMIGQTEEIAPADRKLYALRDATATVESPCLICASIMSKKLAEGTDALVLDVKTGSGAFMKKEEDAAGLAELMVETGKRAEKKVVALITDMDQPLGTRVGNALEVRECLEVMRGGGPEDLRELCLELAGWMLYLGGAARTPELGRTRSGEVLQSGDALGKFRRMVELQGGDPRVIDDPSLLPRANYTVEHLSPSRGFVAEIDGHSIGMASAVLGGGRARKEEAIDPAVGLVLHRKLGDRVSPGDSLLTIHYNSETRADAARVLLANSFTITGSAPRKKTLIHRVIAGSG